MTAFLSEKTMENRRKYNREYYKMFKSEILEKKKKHRKNNEKYNQYMKDYYCTISGRANRMFHGAKRRANVKNLPFEITLDRIKNSLTVGKCERTGIEFRLTSISDLFAPSIDRIDSEKGYTDDNTQIVCVAYNLGKQHMTDGQFEEFILTAADFIKGNTR